MIDTARRTNTETAAEIHALKELLSRVPQHSAFGDGNHEAITAHIRVIQESMSRGKLLEEYEDGDSYVLGAALDALSWLDNDGDAVSEGWAKMVAA